MKQFLETEKKVIRLVEERGVAASKYNNVAKDIIKYCQKQCFALTSNYLNNKKEEKTIQFSIPYELTSQIDFVENLQINVTITDDENGEKYSGGGKTNFKYSNNVVNNKIEFGEIEIYGYSHYGILYSKTILNSLYHELNHCYEYYNDIINNNGKMSYNFFNRVKRGNPLKEDLFNNDSFNKFFRDMIYRLFSETEFNALIASVYGDLEGINSKRKNFANDIKKTQAYFLYDYFKRNYKILINAINEKNISKIKVYLDNLNIKIIPYNDGILSYKKELTRKISHRLTRLIKGIGRAASVYYDNSEFKPLKGDTLTHIDNNIKMN